jgi:hypothetical protein
MMKMKGEFPQQNLFNKVLYPQTMKITVNGTTETHRGTCKVK